MGPLYSLPAVIARDDQDLALLEFQLQQIELMVKGLHNDVERKLWRRYARRMRQEIGRRREQSRASFRAVA